MLALRPWAVRRGLAGLRRRVPEIWVPGIQFSLSESPAWYSSRDLPSLSLYTVNLEPVGYWVSDSRRPREDTVRESFFLFWGGCPGARRNVLEIRDVRGFVVRDSDFRRERGVSAGESPSPVSALRASVSQYSSHARESRDLPNNLSRREDTPLAVRPRDTALLHRRSVPNLACRADRTAARSLHGDGSLAVLTTASPSAEKEIRTGSRGFCGDGVFSFSPRTTASPSNDKDMRRDGGPNVPTV